MVKHCTVMDMKELLLYLTTWIHLTNIVMSERRQTSKYTCDAIYTMSKPGKTNVWCSARLVETLLGGKGPSD